MKKGIKTVDASQIWTPQFERWKLDISNSKEWKDSPTDYVWLITLRQIAKDYGCQIIFDSMHHWKESVFSFDFSGEGPTILCGGGKRPSYSCTALLHEIGHLLLLSTNQHPGNILQGEEEAWKIAQNIAKEYRLPFVSHIKRQGLYSYRYRLIYQRSPGSKHKYRKRPLPHSWQLEGSRQTSKASVSTNFSFGKKGRMYAKRYIKRATSKAIRKQKLSDS